MMVKIQGTYFETNNIRTFSYTKSWSHLSVIFLNGKRKTTPCPVDKFKELYRAMYGQDLDMQNKQFPNHTLVFHRDDTEDRIKEHVAPDLITVLRNLPDKEI